MRLWYSAFREKHPPNDPALREKYFHNKVNHGCHSKFPVNLWEGGLLITHFCLVYDIFGQNIGAIMDFHYLIQEIKITPE